MWYAIVVSALVSYLLGNLNGAVCISRYFMEHFIEGYGLTVDEL